MGTDKAGQLWLRVEQVSRAVARAEIDAALKNMRPGGLAPYSVTIVEPVADLVVPAAHIDIPHPGIIQLVTFRSAEVGSAVADIWTRRPGQLFADALSIVGAAPPSITAATDAEVSPVIGEWTTFVEAGSTVYYYLTSCSGFLSLTINIALHCT